MKRPSARIVAISSISFITGFVIAALLAGSLVFWLARTALNNLHASTIDELVNTNQLLYTADTQPNRLVSEVISNANLQSLSAAMTFSGLEKRNQMAVLRQFAQMNRSTTLQADHNPMGRTALLARATVLCTHESADPGDISFGKRYSRAFIAVPGWVLDPDAKSGKPDTSSITSVEQTPKVVAAESRKWDALHRWVITHCNCLTGKPALSP